MTIPIAIGKKTVIIMPHCSVIFVFAASAKPRATSSVALSILAAVFYPSFGVLACGSMKKWSNDDELDMSPGSLFDSSPSI